MLQLPQPSPSQRRFSRAEVAEITRGTKIKAKKPKPEPVIALVKRADAALTAYYDAWNSYHELLASMPEADRGWPRMAPPPDLTREFGYNFLFSSTSHVRKQFHLKIRNARERIAHHKASLRRWCKPGHGVAQLVREVTAQLAADQKLLVLLQRSHKKCISDFQKRERTLLAKQRKAGLLDARKIRRRAALRLAHLTKQIGKSKPKTVDGALAIVGYVETRQWCDRPALFNDESGDFPGNFGPLLRLAHKVLVDHYKKVSDVSNRPPAH